MKPTVDALTSDPHRTAANVERLWREMLQLSGDAIPRDRSLFELGASSLQAVALAARMQSHFDVDVTVLSLTENPTIAAMSRHVADLLAERDAENAAGAAAAGEPGRPAQGSGSAAGAGDRRWPLFSRNPAARFEPFPLTDLQQAYLIGEQDFYRDRTVAYLYQQYRVDQLDRDRFFGAVRAVVAAHDVLRLTIGGDGVQVVRPAVEYQPAYEDLRSLSPAMAELRVAAKARTAVDDLAPLSEGVTWCISIQQLPDHDRIHVVVRLAAFDAVTLHAIYRDLAGFYDDPAYCPPLGTLSYRDYVMALVGHRDTAAYRRSLTYWRTRAQVLPAAPALPRARSDGRGESQLERRSGRLGVDDWQRLRENAKGVGRPINTALCAVYVETLRRWSRNKTFSVNVLSAYRPPVDPDVGRVVGNCSTTTIVAAAAEGGTFSERVERLQRQIYADLEHNDVSGVEVIRELMRLRSGEGDGEPPMPVVFTSGIGLLGGSENFSLLVPRADWTLVDSRLSTPQVWLDHQVLEERGELVFNWDFSAGHFPAGMIDEMFEHYRQHLLDLARRRVAWTEKSRPLPASQLAPREKANATRLTLPRETLAGLFVETARAQPDRTAIASKRMSLTYGETSSFAARVASALQQHDVQPGDLVGVLLPKGATQVVATLGVLLAGAAYLPFDANLPAARIRQILLHSGARAIIVDEHTQGAVDAGAEIAVVPMPSRPAAGSPRAETVAGVRDLDVAYVIYTSGSTGQPKGVVIDHRGAVNTILDVNRRFGMTDRDRVLALSSLGFDLSVFDIFGAFAAGAAVVVPDDDGTPNPELWLDALDTFGATVWNSVPVVLQIALDYLGGAAARFGSLRLIMLSGDWIPLPLVDKVKRDLPSARLVGLGGATEASIWSNFYEIDELRPEWSSVPYGFPLANQTLHVLDQDLDPTPTRALGDLYIGGLGVAKGYLNDPEKTAASFIVHPRMGERLYRTGDLARYMPDGAVEFAGREDSQVKIRGFRVELGEIEAVLQEYPRVERAVAVVQGTGASDQRLVAFLTGPHLVDGEVNEIRASLQNKLPAYMVPGAFVLLEALPLSANGKVDRATLLRRKLELAPENGRGAPKHAAPRTRVEAQLAKLWRDVLGIEDLGVEDDFFASGGNSLQAVRLFTGIERLFHRRLPLSSLFRTRTIAGQAALLGEATSDGSSMVVPLHTTRATDELVALVHPVGGDILCYQHLASLLSEGLDVVGIRSLALDHDVPSPLELEDTAAAYARALHEAYPNARLHLAGWSMGGVLAYECARWLRAAGHAVGGVVLIDSWVGRPHAGLGEFELLEGFFVDLVESRSVREVTTALRSLPQDAWVSAALAKLEQGGLLPSGMDPDRVRRLFDVYSVHMRALERYRPQPYGGRALFFRAERQIAEFTPNLVPFTDWLSLEDGVRHSVVSVPLDHYGVMKPASVAMIAAEIRRFLRQTV